MMEALEKAKTVPDKQAVLGILQNINPTLKHPEEQEKTARHIRVIGKALKAQEATANPAPGTVPDQSAQKATDTAIKALQDIDKMYLRPSQGGRSFFIADENHGVFRDNLETANKIAHEIIEKREKTSTLKIKAFHEAVDIAIKETDRIYAEGLRKKDIFLQAAEELKNVWASLKTRLTRLPACNNLLRNLIKCPRLSTEARLETSNYQS